MIFNWKRRILMIFAKMYRKFEKNPGKIRVFSVKIRLARPGDPGKIDGDLKALP